METKSPKFYNKSGELNHYGLACGYVEKTTKNGIEKQLYMEHSHYHVMIFSVEIVEPYIGIMGVKTNEKRERLAWEVFDTLTEARKFYHKKYKK